jgi:hypothetical protein
MNERIRQLAEQATEYANEQNELHGVGYVITFKEKFAGLIVKECADIALTDGQATGNFEVFNKITKHFGVEK